jgi:hypothetical protein
MQLSLFRDGNNLADSSEEISEDTIPLRLSPSHPVLDCTVPELEERRSTEVLHVRVEREVMPGVRQVAHLHFSLRVLDNDRIQGEVVAITGPHKQTSKMAVAGWRDAVNPTPPKSAPFSFGSPGIGKSSRTDQAD